MQTVIHHEIFILEVVNDRVLYSERSQEMKYNNSFQQLMYTYHEMIHHMSFYFHYGDCIFLCFLTCYSQATFVDQFTNNAWNDEIMI